MNRGVVMAQEENARAVDLKKAENNREAAIVRTGIIGIVANIALAAFKAFVGLASHSIAIVLDAVNNLSDAASSVITIVGTRLANKQPDHNHPYGHGRAEYLTTIVVAVVVLWAGLSSAIESVKSILNPATPDYKPITLIIVAVAVAVKLVLGIYVKGQGERLDASSLVASGEDALTDALISASTLIAAFVYLALGVQLEAWLALIISFVIIKSGYEIMRDALSKVLGERVSAELAQSVKGAVCEVEGVHGAYDLVLTDYGPQRLQGSVHVEVDEDVTAREIDQITRHIQLSVLRETGVILHTVGVYSVNTSLDSVAGAMREALIQIVEENEYLLQAHGLYVDEQAKAATFDLVVSFSAPDRHVELEDAVAKMRALFPGYDIFAALDADISD